MQDPNDGVTYPLKLAHLALLLLVVSCGGSSAPSAAEVSARCNEFGETRCSLSVACGIETHWIPSAEQSAQQAGCVTSYKSNVDCSRKTKLTGNPDACDADMARTPCEAFRPTTGLPLPASCRGLFE